MIAPHFAGLTARVASTSASAVGSERCRLTCSRKTSSEVDEPNCQKRPESGSMLPSMVGVSGATYETAGSGSNPVD